jgi:threonine/homoserine/homoserine lactone efflux protein
MNLQYVHRYCAWRKRLVYNPRMNEYAFLIGIAGVLMAGAMSPGPSFFVVAKNSLGHSRSHGVATAVGTGLGVAIFAVLASFGVTALLKSVPSAFLVFKFVGGAYLLYLAWKIWSGASEPLQGGSDSDAGQISRIVAFRQGLITQTSNPKTALVIAGIFAAFVPSSPPANTTWLVALIAFVIDFGWYAIVAISLSTRGSRRIYQTAKVWLDRGAAVFLGAVGLKLFSTDIAA